MENMQYAEELVREFLIFRGFTNTLQAFERELGTDIGKGFEVEKIIDLIFSVYIPKFQAENLIALLGFFKQCFSSLSEPVFIANLSKLEVSILRYYIVHAIRSGRRDKVIEFFGMSGDDLLLKDQDWALWFSIPYVKNPSSDPQFRVYFSQEWFNALHLSVRNFLSEMFNGTRIPALLKISTERNTINCLKRDVKQLNLKLSELQALLEEKEAQLGRSRSNLSPVVETRSSGVQEETYASSSPHMGEADSDVFGSEVQPEPALPYLSHQSSKMDHRVGNHGMSNDVQTTQDGTYLATPKEMQGDEELPEVKVDFQETFLGHTSPISRCRFSASGNNVASASLDGTVRIWTYDSSVPASRNATIYCGAEIMSLEWDCRSDRLLLIGTADGGIKAWNVDAKRVVCDLNTTEAFPSVLDLKCSPVEPIFVSAAASRGHGTSYIDKMGFASLTVWNMKTWKAMSFLLAKILQQLLHCASITMGRS